MVRTQFMWKASVLETEPQDSPINRGNIDWPLDREGRGGTREGKAIKYLEKIWCCGKKDPQVNDVKKTKQP